MVGIRWLHSIYIDFCSITEFSPGEPSIYRISAEIFIAWVLSFSMVTFLSYCSLTIKDFGVWVFTVPLIFLSSALMLVRSDLAHSSATLEKSFKSVDFVAHRLAEKIFLTNGYYSLQYSVWSLIILLIIIQNMDAIKERVKR